MDHAFLKKTIDKIQRLQLKLHDAGYSSGFIATNGEMRLFAGAIVLPPGQPSVASVTKTVQEDLHKVAGKIEQAIQSCLASTQSVENTLANHSE